MKHWFFSFGFLVFFLLCPFFSGRAENLGGFTLDSIDAKVTINSEATFNVVETITGDFQEERHGLYREIPNLYNTYKIFHKSTPIEILSVKKDGQPEPFEIIHNGSLLTIKIGDPNQTFSGPFEYQIEYKVSRAFLYEKEGLVSWYWDVAEYSWGTPVGKITAEVVLPAGASNTTTECWGGTYNGDGDTCKIFSNNQTISASSDDLLTLLVKFKPPENFYIPTETEKIKVFFHDNWDGIFLFLPLIVFFVLYRIWSKTGRDPRGRGTIIAEYEVPENLSPFEVSSLYFAGLKDTAVTATIIDLAVRGYLRIEEIPRTSDWIPSSKYKLIKLKKADSTLRNFEKDLLDKVFVDGSEKLLSDCREELIETRTSMDNAVWKQMISSDYFPHDPDRVRSWYIGFAGLTMLIALTAGIILIGTTERYFIAIGFGLVSLELFIFTPLMSRRTEKGVLTLEKVKGFKLFLTTAEKYRLQWQEKEGIFEKFLPYAIVFGVTSKWAKNFEGLMQNSPTWFSGVGISSFSSFSHSLNSFVSTSTSASTPSSSSGGGSSGGGFGGGGGGSW